MGTVVCFISEDFADFEITLAMHKIRNVGKRKVMTAAYSHNCVISESGLTYKPDLTIQEAILLDDIEALIIPGGPIRDQEQDLTELIRRLDQEKVLLAAICHGPQYLGRVGVLEGRAFTTSCSIQRIQQMGVQDPFPRINQVNQRVVRDGHIVTAVGRAFVDFSFAVFDYLGIYRDNEQDQEQLWKDIMDRAN